jgi:hypothetical protein
MKTNASTHRPYHRPQAVYLPMPAKAALQTREAAEYLSISQLSLKRLAYRGILHPNRALGRLLWPIRQLDEFLADPTRACAATALKKARKSPRLASGE